jgi:hypothetical protein
MVFAGGFWLYVTKNNTDAGRRKSDSRQAGVGRRLDSGVAEGVVARVIINPRSMMSNKKYSLIIFPKFV